MISFVVYIHQLLQHSSSYQLQLAPEQFPAQRQLSLSVCSVSLSCGLWHYFTNRWLQGCPPQTWTVNVCTKMLHIMYNTSVISTVWYVLCCRQPQCCISSPLCCPGKPPGICFLKLPLLLLWGRNCVVFGLPLVHLKSTIISFVFFVCV